MHSLTPITALGGTEPCVNVVAGLTCTEVTDLALASVSARLGHDADCVAILKDLVGMPPPEPGKAALAQPMSAVWTGPGQWMIGASTQTHEDLAALLKTELKDTASVTEQTDAWTGFDLTGEGIEQVMELMCNIDTRSMRSGDATRTSIHHLGCFVICGDPQSFVRILGPRASAGSLLHAVTTAMTSAL